MKLGDIVKVNSKYVRVNSQKEGTPHTSCKWELKKIPETTGIITGIRVLSNGLMTNEGYYFESTFKVLKVAINLKSEIYTTIYTMI